jgi:2-C-methyl-D-erythritol 2,4-cyclodiphosphate synthase
MIRIGYGYDVHRLVPSRPLILGGVEIPFELGLLGHSDADVLLHAVIDALLGAMAKGDIGVQFPDTDPTYEGIDSRTLLRRVRHIMLSDGYKVVNIDATICAQKPYLREYIPLMIKNIATDLQTSITNISVKATTEENLGISGSGDGMTATAVVLIERREKTRK